MDLELDERQHLLAQTARAFVARSCPLARVRELEATSTGFDAQLWAAAASLGWTGLVLPEEYGGSSQGLLELVVLCDELGRGLFPSPLVTSVASVALPVLWAGTDEQRQRWLPELASGTTIGTLAAGPPAEVQQGRLSGTTLLVPWADVADLILVEARFEGRLALVAVDGRATGVSCTRHDALGGEPLYAVRLDGVAIERSDIVFADDGTIARAEDHAAIAGAAFAVGAAERALEMTVEHAKDRQQFGRPIGAFQAVAHRCVDMRADIDACRVLVHQAAWAIDRSPQPEIAVGAAKAYANEALRRVFAHAHQVHGAIGFSTEHDLHLFTRRAKAFELAHGSTSRHLERVAQGMGL